MWQHPVVGVAAEDAVVVLQHTPHQHLPRKVDLSLFRTITEVDFEVAPVEAQSDNERTGTFALIFRKTVGSRLRVAFVVEISFRRR